VQLEIWPKDPRPFRRTKTKVSIQKYAKVAKKFLRIISNGSGQKSFESRFEGLLSMLPLN
jgi:hypothetical protein